MGGQAGRRTPLNEPPLEIVKAAAVVVDAGRGRNGHPPGQVVESGRRQAGDFFRVAEEAVSADHAQPVPGLADHPLSGPLQPPGLEADALQQFALVGHDYFCSRRRGGRPGVGDKVGNRKVGFVAHGAHDRNAAGGNGPGQDFLVEGPEVFCASAAAADDYHLDLARQVAVEKVDCTGDFLGGAGALHANVVDQNVQPRPAAREHVNDVANGRPGGTGHHGDGLRAGRQRLLSVRCEEALFLQPYFEFAELYLQGPDAQRLQARDVELAPPARSVKAHVPAGQHLGSVFDPATDFRRLVAPHDAADLRAFVLEVEVEVPAGGPFAGTHLADDPDLGEAHVQDVGDASVQLGDRERAVRRSVGGPGLRRRLVIGLPDASGVEQRQAER